MNINPKMLRAKELLLDKFKKAGPRAGGSTGRLPPGQHLVTGFPVLDLGVHPPFDPATWHLTVDGLVEQTQRLSWQQFTTLPKAEQVSDFHCVTTWSKYDVRWQGVKFCTLVEQVRPNPNASHVILECGDGYTTNLPLRELSGDDVLLAYELEGAPLPLEHGGPLRMLVPHLYAWKSAKFLTRITFQDRDTKGFWEVRGYHNHADPWKEERYS
ncbi:MAG TPA: sulfite oxidase-like oxidoreductase [bacterium]|nr:sulfite oxidase-like oxidoreductase [bacterium]